MNIPKIQLNGLTNTKYIHRNNNMNVDCKKSYASQPTTEFAHPPIGFQYNANIHFTGLNDKTYKVHVDSINWEDYMEMSPTKKKRLKILSQTFDQVIDDEQRAFLLKIDPHPDHLRIPLQSKDTMEQFLKAAKMYSEYRDHPIVCLGRSPKWFLNASFYMTDGIMGYDFVPFSGSWYKINDGDFGDNSGLRRIDDLAPTKSQETAYRKYLAKIEADPVSLIKKADATGHKVIITDYIDTGKGLTSFLELMSKYAQEQGVLDEFGHSFDLVTIGSNEYRQNRKNVEYLSNPSVWMPELLEPYNRATTAWGTGQIIQQRYFNLDRNVHEEMLMNQITNECRSTFYPRWAWDQYDCDKFKIGKFYDLNKYEDLINNIAASTKQKSVSIYNESVQAFRNLLNALILSALEERNMLRQTLPDYKAFTHGQKIIKDLSKFI